MIETNPAEVCPLTVPNGLPSAISARPSPLKSSGIAGTTRAAVFADDAGTAPASPDALSAATAETVIRRATVVRFIKPPWCLPKTIGYGEDAWRSRLVH